MQHDGGVLANRVKHYRLFTFRCNFAHNINCFRFKFFQMGHVVLLLSVSVVIDVIIKKIS